MQNQLRKKHQYSDNMETATFKRFTVPLDILTDIVKVILEMELKNEITAVNENKAFIEIKVEYQNGLGFQMWRNPFYCGICVHKMLDGTVVKGNWEKMVSEQDFLVVQEILKGNRQGYKQDKANPNRPLNAFICCADCGGKLAGYEVKKRNRHYYKCQTCKEISINADYSAKFKLEGAHELFVTLLEKYTLKTELAPFFKTQLKYTYETLNKERTVESEILKKELEKAQESLKGVNKRYFTDPDLDKELYKSVKYEFESKINDLKTKIAKLEDSLSNIDIYINASEEIARNISKYWVSEGLETKRRVQDLVFNGKLSLDVKKRSYLTHETNFIFDVSSVISRDSEAINDKRQSISQLPSSLVAGE